MAYNTGNPSGSSDPRDLSDSSADIDTWATSTTADTHPDRLGAVRKTWRGMENEFDADQSARASEFEADQDSREAQFAQLMISGGYTGTGTEGAIEEYDSGITVSAYKEIIRESGEFWRAAADTTLPYTTTGAGMPEGGAFVNVGDGVLRQDLIGGTAIVSSSTGSQTVAGALDSRVIRVNTLADLKSLDSEDLPDNSCAQITTTGRAGSFTWMTGDRSSQVASDPSEGIWVAPDSDNSGASGAWMRQYSLWNEVNVQWFGAVDDFDWDTKTGTDSTEAIRQAVYKGLNTHCPRTPGNSGQYMITDNQILLNYNQVLRGDGCGSSYGPSPDVTHVTVTDLVFVGTGERYVQTRRQPRESASDPQDDPLAVGVNMQHEGAVLKDIAVRLWVDYTDNDPQNLGDDYDVGVLVGCAQQQLRNVRVYGYWRKAAIWQDGTKSSKLPRFTAPDGVEHAPVTFTGTDQVKMFNVLTKGGWKGLFLAGAKNGDSGDYYDELSDETYSDEGGRGAAGMSDYHAFDCTVWGPDHHSGWRRVDPTSGTDFDDQDIDEAAGGVFIDGRRTPGALGGRTRLHQFTRLRVRSYEAVRVGLGACSETYFYGLHTETAGPSGVTIRDTNGNQLSSPPNYGSIAVKTPTDGEATGSVGTTSVYVYGPNGVIPAQNFRDKFERWEIFSTGGGATGGRTYLNDLRLCNDTLQLSRSGPVNRINTADGDTLTLAYDGNTRIRITNSLVEAETPEGPANEIRLRQGGDSNAFSVGGTTIRTNRIIAPVDDNTTPLGLVDSRFSELRAGNDTINTSDGREKQDVIDVPDKVLDAWADVQWVQYRWKASVEEKGDGARLHFGVVAQQVKQAFESHGLDAFDYSLLCYDEWEAEEEVRQWRDPRTEEVQVGEDEDGTAIYEAQVIEEGYWETITPAKEAGSRYGIRYSQAEAVEAAYQRRRMKRLEAKLAQLENQNAG